MKNFFGVSRQDVAILILLPIIYTLLFGGLFYRNSLTEVPVIICNLDDGSAGRSLVEDFRNTPELKVIAVEGDALDEEKFLREDTAAGIVVIPKEFSNRLARGENVSVELAANHSSNATGGTVLRAVQSVVGTKNAEVTVTRRIAAGWSEDRAAAQLSVSTRIFFNPTSGYTDFFLAALILHGGQIATIFVIAPALVLEKNLRGREFFRNIARRLGEKILLCVTLETAVMMICLSLGVKVFGMVCRGDPLEILALTAAYVACVTAFGLMMGALVREPYHAITWALVYVMPSILFANVTWPRTSMDGVSLLLSYVMPIGYAADDLRSLFVKGASATLEVHIAALLVMGGIFLAVAFAVLKLTDVTKTDDVTEAQPRREQCHEQRHVSKLSAAVSMLIRERAPILVILLFAATAYSLLIGNLYKGGTVQRIPVAVCDLEDSPLSRELIRAVADADQYDFRETLSDDAAAVRILERGAVAAVLVIPEDFSEKFYRAESVSLACLMDGSNVLQTGYASAPMTSVCSAFAAEFNRRAAMLNGTPQLSPAPVTLSLRLPANAPQSYLAFYMYGVMLMAAQVGMMMSFAMSVHEDVRADFDGTGSSRSSHDDTASVRAGSDNTGSSRRGILIALVKRMIFYLTLSMFSVALGIFFLATFGNLPFRGAVGDAILICAAFLFAVEGIAGLAGIFFSTKLTLVQAMVFYTLPAFLLSGYIWPEVGMTGIIRAVSMLQPVHYVLTDFRILSLTGVAPQINQHAAILLAIGSVSFVVLYGLLLRRKLAATKLRSRQG